MDDVVAMMTGATQAELATAASGAAAQEVG
jgi:hypothetical protein